MIVGVNRYTEEEARPEGRPVVPIQKIEPRLESDQRARLAAFKKRRSGPAAAAALDGLEQAARGRENLVRVILRAVEAQATLGEISDRLRSVFGTHRPATGI